jgi:DNA oxidative demethylase
VVVFGANHQSIEKNETFCFLVHTSPWRFQADWTISRLLEPQMKMTVDLFDIAAPNETTATPIASGAWLLHGFALGQDAPLTAAFDAVTTQAPLRHLVTPGGHTMSVAMSNCGSLGWVSDARGYRYAPCDPLSGKRWPAMPAEWIGLATQAAAQAGYANFKPDACLINTYAPGARMGLHQDRDERDFSQPIVSVSLGLSAVFLFGGLKRADKPQRIRLVHGDVVVWGGSARLAFHGVAPMADGVHAAWGRRRVNLTFRCAGQR